VRDAPDRRALGRRLAIMALVGTAYYLGAKLGLSLSLVEKNVTPLWPPTGIAVAAFLVYGRGLWPAVAVAALAVNLPISETFLAAAVTAVGNTLAPWVAVTLLRLVGFRRQLDRLKDALAIVFLGALGSMLISATVGAGTLVVSHAIPRADFAQTWAVWWTGDAMGVLVIAPFLLSLPLFRELEPWPWSSVLECGLILVAVAALMSWAATTEQHVLFLALPLVGYASWRLQLRGVAPAALIASLILTSAATREVGPFADRSLFQEMFTLQAFNACVALMSFFLAALVTERNRTARALAATAEARADREHQIAETLQRSLLPSRIPDIPGVAVAARYVPATSDVEVGGDWYDVVQLPNGLIGLAIGDVAGHGLVAAATMGQVRMALRAYALQNPSPASVLLGVHRLVAQLPDAEMVTLIYLVFDPATRTLLFANAGHPPALVFSDGGATFLGGALAPPVGVTAEPHYTESSHTLEAGATLLLYTDGLVERRGVSIQRGLDRLSAEVMAAPAADLDKLCDRLLSTMLEDGQVADDVALLTLRIVPFSGAPLHVRVPAEARQLGEVRGALRRWLRESGVAQADAQDILVAAGEACANVVQHAYGATPGELDLTVQLDHDQVEILVRDRGAWRPAADRGGGWGLQLIRSLMEDIEVEHEDGTSLRMRRHVELVEREDGDE